MSFVSINLVVLRSANLDLSSAFYSKLGLVFAQHQHGSGPLHLTAELAGSVFEIYPSTPSFPPSVGTRVGFRVPSLDNVIAALAYYPGSIISEPKTSPWGYRAVVVDPDGHHIELVED
jgi:lactoylglutathione lyase